MSNSRVTITLGRTGQVVRRGGLDDNRSDSRSLSGSKRSIRDRLGSDAASSSSSSNKRQRGVGGRWSMRANGADGVRVGRNDLRLKLLQKNLSKRVQGDAQGPKKDLREKLSRTIRYPLSVNKLPQRSELKESSLLRQIPSVRSQANLLLVDSSRRSFSSLTIDAPRCRSPDRVLRTSRGISPPRNTAELRQAPSLRAMTIDASRNRLLPSNGFLEPSRPMGTSSVTRGAPLESSKPVLRLPPQPTNGMVHKSSFMGEEPLTVAGLLHSLGLGKYAIHFQAEEVDMTVLRQMGDNDLKEMGIPMGPRKKILLAIMPRSKRQPP